MRRRSTLRAAGIGLALVCAATLVGCFAESETPTPVPTPTAAPTPTPLSILVIESPEDGDVVRTASVQVVGTAPPGAEIIQDVDLFGDRRTSADTEGDWVMTVDLEEGDNDLVFRIGDEEATTKTIRVVYLPAD
jgi:hypothetical protein